MNEILMTGYPSIDKPWLKYYSKDALEDRVPNNTIFEYLWDNNKDHLDDVAINYYDNKITFGKVFDNIEKASKAFYNVGVRKGDIVIIATVTTPETVYALYGLNRIGAVCNMVDPRTSIDGIKTYIDEVDASYILTLDTTYPKVIEAIEENSSKTIIIVSPKDSIADPVRYTSCVLDKNSQNESSRVYCWKKFIEDGIGANPEYISYAQNTCCIIVHTGGTTGFPKGVMLSNENLNEMALCWKYNKLSFDRGNILLSIMPPFIAYGIVNGIHVVLSRGMQIVMIPMFNPKQFAYLVLKYKPATMLATPTHYDCLLYSDLITDSTDLSFIQMVGIGGDGLHISNESRLNNFFKKHNCQHRVVKGYGMTEVSASSCANHPNNNPEGSVGLPFLRNIIAAFKPGTEIELKVGEVGEICIYSPSTMIGYYNNPDETNRIKKTHLDGREWIHTGDLGYISEDGNVYIQGRLKRIIVRYDGFKVFPVQIERAIMNSEDVENCCTVGIQDTEHSQGSLPLSFVVKRNVCRKSDEELTKELLSLCKKDLPEYAQPVSINYIEKLPVTSVGKVDYRSLEITAKKYRI